MYTVNKSSESSASGGEECSVYITKYKPCDKYIPQLYKFSNEIKKIFYKLGSDVHIILLLKGNKCKPDNNIVGIGLWTETNRNRCLIYIHATSLNNINKIIDRVKPECVHTPSQELIENLRGYSSPVIIQNTMDGYIYTNPLVRVCSDENLRFSDHSGGPKAQRGTRDESKNNNSVNDVFNELNRYVKSPKYRFKIKLSEDCLKGMKDAVHDSIKSGNKQEAGGRIEVHSLKSSSYSLQDSIPDGCELQAILPEKNEFGGDGNNVVTKIYGIGYHTHLLDGTKTKDDLLYLVGWASGDDYLADFVGRFSYNKIARYISLIAGDHGLYCLKMNIMAVEVVKRMIKESDVGDISLVVLMGMAIKLYFIDVENIRTVHPSNFKDDVLPYLEKLKKCARETNEILVSNMTFNKMLEILRKEKERLMRGTNNFLNGNNVNSSNYDEIVDYIEKSVRMYDCHIFTSSYVSWEDAEECDVMVELDITDEELKEAQKVIDPNDPYLRNFLPMDIELESYTF